MGECRSFSTAWVTAWPDPDAYLSNAEFAEVVATYFGLSSPACRSLVGQPIGTGRKVMDAHGHLLTTIPLPGDGWRTQHDALKWRISEDMRDMGARVTTEVYGLFAPHIPQQGRRRLDRETVRKRQGLVPDFMFYEENEARLALPCLLELKTLHYGTSTYSHSLENRCSAVSRRAGAIPTEYVDKAKNVDTQYCGTPSGQHGPVLQKLLSFGRVRGLVFGVWGEASRDVEQLLGQLARQGAKQKWRQMGCIGEEQAVGCLAWLLRRRWGLTAVRECARLKLERLAFVGRGAAAASRRRQAGIHAYSERERLYRARASFERRRR